MLTGLYLYMKKIKMESQNKYLGDDKFKKFLEHYNCPTPLEIVKLRFIGSICSPNLELRPTDVISSFWERGKAPRLETKDEADLFFKFFMGLWDEMFQLITQNKVKLSPVGSKLMTKEGIKALCSMRFSEIEAGFVEGFWGGKDDLKLQAYLAEIIDSLSEMAGVYNTLAKKLDKSENIAEISKHLVYTDTMVEKAIAFIIENSVLPRIETLKRVVH